VCVKDTDELAYQPACDIHSLTVASIMERLDQRGIDSIPIAESSDLNKIRETLTRLCEVKRQSPANLELEQLCMDAQPK
jgi:membrane protein